MELKLIHIYSDESRHRSERFMLLGGLWIAEEDIALLDERIKNIRHKYGYTDISGKYVDFLGEFKWTKVSNTHLSIYKEIVDLFFELIEQNVTRFCCMLVDTHDPIVARYDNLKKDGFYHLLYQLYLHNCRVPGIYKIFPDQITNPTHAVNFPILNRALEKGLRNKFAPLINPEKLPEKFLLQNTPMDSKKSQALQMIDVLIGALGYYQNRYFEKVGSKAAKQELMRYVMDKFIYTGTFKIEGKHYMIVHSTRLNIWLFRPKHKNSPS